MIALVELLDNQGRRWTLAVAGTSILSPIGHDARPILLANAPPLSVTAFKVVRDAAGQENPDG